MAKRSRTPAPAATDSGVGPRQPCPCGSGKRYKACHGAPGGASVYVARPFAGLASECDIVAMRELVPSATAPLPLLASGPAGGESRPVVLHSLLPAAAPAMVRESGQIWLGLQVQHGFGDPSRDLAAVLLTALTADVGIVGLLESPGEGPRLQDLVTADPLSVTVHNGFDHWIADLADTSGMAEALEQANAAASPSSRLGSVEAAYWTDAGSKEHLRWVMPEPEDLLLDALARLHEAGSDSLVDGSRLVGMFRTQGLLVPVWDLPVGTGADVLESPAVAFKRALGDALADTSDLTAAQRAARSGLATRQVTIR